MLYKSMDPPSGPSSVGGITYKGDRGSAVARARAMPRDPRRDRQSNERPSFSGIAQRWKLLSSMQQAGWDDYAAAVALPSPGGGTHFVSGFAMFCRTNGYWLQIANWSGKLPTPIPAAIVEDAPTDFDLGVPVDAVTLSEVGIIDATLSGTFAAAIPDSATFLLYAGRLVNSSREAYHASFQLAYPFGVSVGATSWSQIVGDYQSPNSWWSAILPAVGQYQALRILLLYDDGRLSLPFQTIVQWQSP